MTIRVSISAKILGFLVTGVSLNDLTDNDLLAKAIAIAQDKLREADRRAHEEAFASESRVLELAGLIGRADFPWAASWPGSLDEWGKLGFPPEDWLGMGRELVRFAAEHAGEPASLLNACGCGRLGVVLHGLEFLAQSEPENAGAIELLTVLGVSDGRDDDGMFFITGAARQCAMAFDPPLFD